MEERIVQRPSRPKEASSEAVESKPQETIAASLPVQRSPKRRISWLVVTFWILGWALILSVFLFLPKNKGFLTGNAVPSSQENGIEAFQSGSESIPLHQQEIIQRLKKEIRGARQELRTEKTQNRELKTREDDYRGELYQMALTYEQELSALRQENLTKENAINDLRSGLQEAQITLEKSKLDRSEIQATTVTSQAGATSDAFAVQRTNSAAKAVIQGKVLMVNSRYEFVIINVGAKQGVAPGKRVAFYLQGREFASGVVERVYPALSGVAVFDTDALMRIQEGQDISVQEY